MQREPREAESRVQEGQLGGWWGQNKVRKGRGERWGICEARGEGSRVTYTSPSGA